MTNLRHIIISVLLVSLFIVSLVIFSVQFQTENGTNVSLLSNSPIANASKILNSTLYIQQGNATQMQQALAGESATPILTALGFFFKSILSAGNTIMSFTILFFGSILTLGSQVLGIPPIVSGVLTTILLLTLILAAWRVYRAGE